MERRTTQSVGHEIQSITTVSNYCILGPTGYTSKGNWWSDTSLPATDKLHWDKDAQNCHCLKGKERLERTLPFIRLPCLEALWSLALNSGLFSLGFTANLTSAPYCTHRHVQDMYRHIHVAEHASVWTKRCLSSLDSGQWTDWRAGRKKTIQKKKIWLYWKKHCKNDLIICTNSSKQLRS